MCTCASLCAYVYLKTPIIFSDCSILDSWIFELGGSAFEFDFIEPPKKEGIRLGPCRECKYA